MTVDAETLEKLYRSGWNHEDPPSDNTDSIEWQIWAAGDNDQEDDEFQADFPLGFDKRYEMFLEWEWPDMG